MANGPKRARFRNAAVCRSAPCARTVNPAIAKEAMHRIELMRCMASFATLFRRGFARKARSYVEHPLADGAFSHKKTPP